MKEKITKFCNWYVEKFKIIITINLLLFLAFIIILLINIEKLIDLDIMYVIIPFGMYFAIIFGTFLILEKRYIKNFKNKYINLSFKNEYKDFSYSSKSNFDIKNFSFLNLKHYIKEMQDYIIAYHKGYKFSQNTVSIQIKEKAIEYYDDDYSFVYIDIFNGIITEFKLQNSYKRILIYTNDLYFEDENNNVTIDNKWISENFIINSIDQNEALSFLNENILRNLKEKILHPSFFILIIGNKLYVGQNCSSDIFNPDFKKKKNDQQIIKSFKDKMIFVDKIVNEFKLEKEIDDNY